VLPSFLHSFRQVSSLRKPSIYFKPKKRIMNNKLYSRIMLLFFISVSFIACNNNKDSEETTTTDTTSTTTMDNMDAVTAAPGLYKVVADSAGIRILDVTYQPGDSSAMHWHPDNAIYVIEGGSTTFYMKDGSKMESSLGSGMSAIRPAESHGVKNTGNNPIHVILFEVNRSGAGSAADPMDATKVAPAQYKSLADSMGIRIVEVNYKPGESSAMHAHPDLGFYVVNSSKIEFTKKDGSKQVVDLPAGAMAVMPAEAHSVKNVGNTAFKGILVEVHRAMK
jgi:quercetin dioxygenase-like cupin family protein